MSDSRSAAANDERAGVYDSVPYNCAYCNAEFQDYRGVEKYEDLHADTRPTTRQGRCSKCARVMASFASGLWEVQQALKGLHNDKLRAGAKAHLVRARAFDASGALDLPYVITELRKLTGIN